MSYSIAMSAGHGLKIRGAHGYIDEVDEARRVVSQVAKDLIAEDVACPIFFDDTSTTQDENLKTIVDWHNAQVRDLDVSVHFNAYQATSKPMGTEVLYLTDEATAKRVVKAIAYAGFINRGAKKRSDLYFLNQTNKPAILIEVCFVDSAGDVEVYQNNFKEICALIAGALRAVELPEVAGRPVVLASFAGKCSWFGGPDDDDVAPDEGLAFIYSVEQAPQLFLPSQPPGTSGLARRLDPAVFYVACRWDYNLTPKTMLADHTKLALVRAPATNKAFLAYPADWGPHSQTGRVADISPGLMTALGIGTDDEVEVTYPAASVPIVEDGPDV